MVAHRGLRTPEGLHEGAGADLSLGLGGDQAEEPETGGIGQSSEAAGQLAGFGLMERLDEDRRAALFEARRRDLSDRQLAPPDHVPILTSVDGIGKMLVSTFIDASEECQGEPIPFHREHRMTDGLGRRLLAEFLGTAFLAVAIIGSGIMASRLSPNDAGLELLENATATAAALVAIILAIGPVSGAHLNPVVTLADRFFGGLSSGEAAGYIGAQFAGGAAGAAAANLMFSVPVVELSTTVRSSGGLWFAEVVATFGLLLVIFGVVRSGRGSAAPFAVGAYVGGAYFFTASTSFANPAVTMARALSHSFAGINPSSVPPFVAAQLVGAGLAVLAIMVLYPTVGTFAADVVVPRETDPITNRRRSGTWRGHHDRSRLYASPIRSPHSSVALPESSGERPAKSKEAS
jgi:arsenate reductase